ncbi:hypothetical protein BD289DRAFT_435027 [Coniella lustricola]|uniref:Uncharacterized protein n=1 Tax=Coniella lustricola TaxID=2025994 RepID=A0A2T3A6V8_9PEZI|nr:hypothetical protein BD289DRAFT_435027 [Coniella lustricola]
MASCTRDSFFHQHILRMLRCSRWSDRRILATVRPERDENCLPPLLILSSHRTHVLHGRSPAGALHEITEVLTGTTRCPTAPSLAAKKEASCARSEPLCECISVHCLTKSAAVAPASGTPLPPLSLSRRMRRRFLCMLNSHSRSCNYTLLWYQVLCLTPKVQTNFVGSEHTRSATLSQTDPQPYGNGQKATVARPLRNGRSIPWYECIHVHSKVWYYVRR